MIVLTLQLVAHQVGGFVCLKHQILCFLCSTCARFQQRKMQKR